MNASETGAALRQSLPLLFASAPAPQEGIRVRTPFLYPDGAVIDLLVLERDDGYAVTDAGDTLAWLELQSAGPGRSPELTELAQEVCQTLNVELLQDQLARRRVAPEELGAAVLRVAQAAVGVSGAGLAKRRRPPAQSRTRTRILSRETEQRIESAAYHLVFGVCIMRGVPLRGNYDHLISGPDPLGRLEQAIALYRETIAGLGLRE